MAYFKNDYQDEKGRYASHNTVVAYRDLKSLTFNVQKYSEEAMRRTVLIAINKLKEFAWNEIYDSRTPKWYSRNYALTNGWKMDEKKFNIYSNYSIRFDPSVLSNTADKGKGERSINQLRYLNASWGKEGQDLLSPEQLIALVNYGHREGKFGFPAMPARPFWDDFMAWMEKNFYNEYLKQCRKIGLPVEVKSNKAIETWLSKR